MQMWHICHFRVVLYCAVCISSCVSAAARMITSVTQAVDVTFTTWSPKGETISEIIAVQLAELKMFFLLQLHFLGRKKELVLNL